MALPPDSALWHWQPEIRYHLVDEKALPGSELERRDSLVALLFRLEAGPGPEDLVKLVDEIIGWFRQHPDYETLKQLFTEIVGYAVSTQERIGIDAATGNANNLLEIREMVSARVKEWQDEVRADALAGALSKLLGRRFGELPPDMAKRIRSAKAEELDEWMDRVLDAASIADVFDNKRTN